MSLTLDEEQVDFLEMTMRAARNLLDNVHAYESEEYNELAVALQVLNGSSVEEARVICAEDE